LQKLQPLLSRYNFFTLKCEIFFSHKGNPTTLDALVSQVLLAEFLA
jgi:hypothetical protein